MEIDVSAGSQVRRVLAPEKSTAFAYRRTLQDGVPSGTTPATPKWLLSHRRGYAEGRQLTSPVSMYEALPESALDAARARRISFLESPSAVLGRCFPILPGKPLRV